MVMLMENNPTSKDNVDDFLYHLTVFYWQMDLPSMVVGQLE